MNTLQFLSLIFLFSLATPTFSQSAEEDVRKLLDQYEVSLRSKSLEKISANFHPDCRILPDGKLPVEGQKGAKPCFLPWNPGF